MGASVIMIASCKGGVGKTTVTANVASALAAHGSRVLMIDCDFGMRCLDLVSGMTEVTYDVCDCVLNDVPLRKAVLTSEKNPRLMFLSAPYRYDGGLDPRNFGAFLRSASRELELDFILLDTHGGEGVEFGLAASVSDLALVVTTQQPTAVRAAEETALRLREQGVTQTRLVINGYDKKAVKRRIYPGVIELIDNTRVQLIGVVPRDEKLNFGMNAPHETETVLAFSNIAKRISGRSMPLSVI